MILFLAYFLFILVCVIFGFLLFLMIKELIQIVFGYGVPFVPTPDYKTDALLQHLNLKKGQKFLDIGCGDGKILETVEKKFPSVNITGLETSYFPYKAGLRRKNKKNYKYSILQKNFF